MNDPCWTIRTTEDTGRLRGREEVDTLKVTVNLKTIVVEVLDQMS